MAATGFTPVFIYSSSTGGNVPAAANLTNNTLGSELAINITDGYLYYKDNANAVQKIGYKLVPVANGGTGTSTAFTTGSVVFAGASGVYSQKNANLFWDNTNDRLGIGTATPANSLEIVGPSGGAKQVCVSDGANQGFIQLSKSATFHGVAGGTDFNGVAIYSGSATARATFFSSGGVSIGNTTDPGATNLSVTGTVTASIYNTLSGSVASVANNTFVTMFAFPNVNAGTWIVTTTVTGQGNAAYYTEVTIVSTQATASNLTRIQTSTGSNVQMSGLNFQYKQTSGGVQTCTYSAIRIF